MPSDKEVVDFIHDLFDDPRRWIKGTRARDPEGRSVQQDSVSAASFCLTGAVGRYAVLDQSARILKLIRRFLPNEYSNEVSFNDHEKTTIDDVRHVLKSVSIHLRHSH